MKDLFYKPFKVNAKEEEICFWSDLHYGHNPIKWDIPLWERRGFDSVDQHDRILIERWNNKVSQEATAFHLGDIIFGYDGLARLKNLLNRLNFKELYLLPGNHVGGFHQLLNELEENIYQIHENKKVILCPNYIEAYCNGIPFVLSHYAIASFNGQGKGSYMVHGHSHSSLYNSELGKLIYTGRVIDVGVENCPEPINLKELKNKFKNIEAKSWDHHSKENQNPF